MLGMPGGLEWVIVLIIALLVFGKRLPGIMRSLGKSVVEFKKGIKGVGDEVDKVEGDIKKNDENDVNIK